MGVMRVVNGAKRLLTLLLAALMLCSAAMAEKAQFTLNVSVDETASSQSKLLQELAAVLSELSVSGELTLSDDSFDVQMQFALDEAPDRTTATLRVFGLDSHWGVQGSMLGSETLMINQLALLEFANKAYEHLSLPLQHVCLLISPYTHTSAWAVAAQPLQELADSAVDGVIPLNALTTCAEKLAQLAEEDRTLYYYIEAIGRTTGADEEIFALLYDLPYYLEEMYPDGLTVEQTAQQTTWLHGEEVVFRQSETEGSRMLSLNLPDLLTLDIALNRDDMQYSGNVAVQSTVLNADVTFAVPASLTTAGVISLTARAEGMTVGEEAVQIAVSGESDGQTINVCFLLPDHQPLLQLTALLSDVTADEVHYSADDIVGVNVLSVNGTSLSELMHSVALPLGKTALNYLTVLPASLVQSAMDELESSGILPTLVDAVLYGEQEEY